MYIIQPHGLTFDNTVLNYFLLDTTYLIRVVSLRDRRLTAPNYTTEPMSWNKCVKIHRKEKTLWSWLIGQNCSQETDVEEVRQWQKVPVGQGP